MDEQDKGEWKTFPPGTFADGHDGQWALLLINKDYDHAHSVKIEFHDAKQHYALAVQ
jgi:hypothetical protein